MKTKDIARITIQNLFRRKTRTLLTVLGVIIGCCSIVIMVSIGIGMKESQEQMLASMGDLTIINVNAPQAGNRQKLDQAALEQIKAIDSVLAVTPKKTLDLGNPKLYAGGDRRFKAEGVPLIGMDMDVLDKFGYTLLEGSYPDARPAALIGQYLEYSFQDSMRPDGHNMISRWGDMSDEWFDETDVYKEPDT